MTTATPEIPRVDGIRLYYSLFYQPPSGRLYQRLVDHFWNDGHSPLEPFSDEEWEEIHQRWADRPAVVRVPIDWVMDLLNRRECKVIARWAHRYATTGVEPSPRWRR